MSTSSKQSGQPQINTSCKTCVFASYNGLTQVGCKAGILQRYKDNDNVIEAYDEEKEFYVIRGIACPYYRTPKWKHAKASNKIAKARAELSMNYDVVIVVDAEENSVSDTIDSLMKQSKRPSKVNIVVPNPAVKFDRATVARCLVPWTVETRIENEGKADRNHLKNIIRKQKSPILVYIKAGRSFNDTDLFKRLEDKIIDQQFQFGMIKISDNEFIIPKVCYDYFNFMAESTVESVRAVEDQEGIIDICNLK